MEIPLSVFSCLGQAMKRALRRDAPSAGNTHRDRAHQAPQSPGSHTKTHIQVIAIIISIHPSRIIKILVICAEVDKFLLNWGRSATFPRPAKLVQVRPAPECAKY
jgi:hypothetical protein